MIFRPVMVPSNFTGLYFYRHGIFSCYNLPSVLDFVSTRFFRSMIAFLSFTHTWIFSSGGKRHSAHNFTGGEMQNRKVSASLNSDFMFFLFLFQFPVWIATQTWRATSPRTASSTRVVWRSSSSKVSMVIVSGFQRFVFRLVIVYLLRRKIDRFRLWYKAPEK